MSTPRAPSLQYGNYALRYGMDAAESARISGLGSWLADRPHLKHVGEFYAQIVSPSKIYNNWCERAAHHASLGAAC